MGKFLSKLCGSDKQHAEINKKFTSKYILKNKIGSGGFSTVYLCHRKCDDQKFAVKSIKKQGMRLKDLNALQQEVKILSSIHYVNIIQFVEFFDEPEHYYLIAELIEGGELFDRIVEKKTYHEDEARDLVRTILNTIAYLHSKNIIHRDLKPENLLLKSRHNDIDIKLADFGFARYVDRPNSLTSICGTPEYVAPEIISRKAYGLKADIWSVGIISFILLGGCPPFYHDNQTLLFSLIKKGEYAYDPSLWSHISVDAKKCISCMLTLDPYKRSSAEELLHHSWLKIPGPELETNDLAVNLQELKKFNARRKFRTAAKAVIAIKKFSSAPMAACNHEETNK